MIGLSLSKAVLNTKFTPRVSPFDGTIDAGDLAGAALQTSGILDHHFPFFVEGIEVRRTGVDTETFFAVAADTLIEQDVGLFVVFEGINRQLLRDFHDTPHQRMVSRRAHREHRFFDLFRAMIGTNQEISVVSASSVREIPCF